MSTITPLIDTLLHQVLGKGGTPGPKELNPPVRPVDAGEGPGALRSDSRLDARADPRIGNAGRLPAAPGSERGAALPSGTPGSTQTHFSPAARSLADVLMRFPAPPSALRPQAPLMSETEAASPQVLAQRLEASVRDSGLFYEAHVKRWFQGDMSRQQLLREPQMQLGVRALPEATGSRALAGAGAAVMRNPVAAQPPLLSLPTPVPFALPAQASTTPQGTTGSAGFITPGSVLLPSSATAHQVAGAAAGAEGADVEINSTRDTQAAAHRSRDVVHESLQGLVRQQLEMLVTPTIRWEGDVWAGIFMALAITVPERQAKQEEQGEEDSGGGASSQENWQTDLRLEVPDLGAFDVSLRLYRQTLNVDLSTASRHVHERLEQGLGQLEARLSALALKQVNVQARYLSEDSDE
ncbi:flagellar hook-length control protein FliK [Halomonas cibimaris]|uniref:Flagellar hook-length control protein FliK n=1 Tax=Halomonas cibimaris TaxID=657012 RepID=A0ABP7LSI3_9GAMM